MTSSVVDKSEIQDGLRIIKVEQFGAKTADECSPFGIDSSPLKDMTAIYSETSEGGEPVIVGYINENQKAGEGETRFYSMGADGEKTYIYLTKDGNIELGGNSKNLVRFQELEQSMNALEQFINTQLPLISSGIATGGGTYTPDVLEIDISQSKTEKIKVG